MKLSSLSLRRVTLTAMLVALEIVLSRFLSFSVWNMKIGLSFVPTVLAAIMLSPLSAGLVAALADVLGAMLFPIGPYFPGFTLSALLLGLIFGLLLRREYSFIASLLAVCAGQLICTLLLNTWCISFLYGAPYFPLLMTRLFQAGTMSVLELALMPMLYRLSKILERQVTA